MLSFLRRRRRGGGQSAMGPAASQSSAQSGGDFGPKSQSESEGDGGTGPKARDSPSEDAPGAQAAAESRSNSNPQCDPGPQSVSDSRSESDSQYASGSPKTQSVSEVVSVTDPVTECAIETTFSSVPEISRADDRLSRRQLFFTSGVGSMAPIEDSETGVENFGALRKAKTESNLCLPSGGDNISLNSNIQIYSSASDSPLKEEGYLSEASARANEDLAGKSVRAGRGEASAKRGAGSVAREMVGVRDEGYGQAQDEVAKDDGQADSEVVKNDSGCWEARPILSDPSRLGLREKKRVQWADIDGQSQLTRSQEDVRACHGGSSSEEESSEGESTEGESSEEEEEEEVQPGLKEAVAGDSSEEEGEDSSEGEEKDSSEGEGEDSSEAEDSKDVEGAVVVEVERKNEKGEDSSEGEEEDSNDEEEGEDSSEGEDEGEDSREGVEGDAQTADSGADWPSHQQHSDSSEDEGEEDESDEESSSGEQPVKNEEPPAIRIDVAELQKRISELQTDIENKTTNIGRLQTELDMACGESKKVRERFRRLEEDLQTYRLTNRALAERLQVTEQLEEEKISRSNRQLDEAEKRIRELESELERVQLDYSKLLTSFRKLEADRNMEVQIVQKALEKALTDQEEMEAKYEKEFENLRTLNSGREVQMLDDFEWKLREVERNCKKKIQEYETEYEQKNVILASQLAAAQADLEQISHLKLCEIELNQLKQTSSEQRKNLRSVNRKLEELQVSEKILQEEVHSLRSSLDKEKAHIIALQTLHKEDLEEKDRKMKLKMEIQIKQFTHEWEERLRKEGYKIKTELEKTFREEKKVAVDTANRLKDQEISRLQQNWEKKGQDLNNEISKLKNKITEIETLHKNDLSNAQTNADRETFDLRRKMDKLDMSYQEKIEKLQEKHDNELATLKEDYDKRLQQSEVAMQMQIGNSRATLELVKQQLRNEAQSKLENLEKQYQQRLEQQWTALQAEKEAAIAEQEEKHRTTLEGIYKEIERTKKQARTEQESLAKRRNQNLNQTIRLNNLQENNKPQDNDKDHSHSLISTRLDVAEVAEEIRTQGKEEVLQRCIEQLTKQLNAGKMEIEKLREQLEARDARTQQNNQQQHGQQQRNNIQQPVPNPRRNRKGRSARH